MTSLNYTRYMKHQTTLYYCVYNPARDQYLMNRGNLHWIRWSDWDYSGEQWTFTDEEIELVINGDPFYACGDVDLSGPLIEVGACWVAIKYENLNSENMKREPDHRDSSPVRV